MVAKEREAENITMEKTNQINAFCCVVLWLVLSVDQARA